LLDVSARPSVDAAAQAATTTLLNCFLREGGVGIFEGDELVVPALDLRADVSYRSACFHHRFAGPARRGGEPLEPPALAELLVRALDPGVTPDALLTRVRASLAAVTQVLDERGGDVERLWSTDPLPFAETEQALLLGHPLHPTPKGLTLADHMPERRARFQLHWLSVDAARVVHDSAVGVPAPQLVAALAGRAPEPGRILLPAHPWEAAYLATHAAAWFERGDVVDLGPGGDPVTPTTSLRTVHRADWPYMLKFSLHAQVTNSVRVSLPKELRRAVEAKRLARTAVGAAAAKVAPHFTILHDPAYLEVPGEDGFSVLLRENRWPGDADVSALTVLCQDNPFGGPSRAALLASRLGAREWFALYLEVVVVSLVRLYLDLGLCFEPHQQNTLLELRDGWPERCVVRDSQGYFHREAAHADLVAVIPGLGEASESIFPEALADERLVYYPFVNNALGVIDALGAGGAADEAVLLGDLRRVLERERAAGGRYPATLLDRLLDDDRWPCKANLRTRLNDMDELVGDIAEQSVYVTLPNPLRVQLEPAATHPGLLEAWLREPHIAPWWGDAHVPAAHVQPWMALEGGVPFAYVETYRVVDDPLAAYYDARADDLGFHLLVTAAFVGTGAARRLVRQLLEHPGRVVCEPDARNARMLAFCRALGGEVRGVLELPDKRAALVVWE
jgi:siderophore synthetase component